MQKEKELLNTFFEDDIWKKIKKFSDSKETPFLVVHLDSVKKHYYELNDSFPGSKIYYAVKANPGTKVIELLRDCGSSFDLASTYELDKVLGLKVSPERISFGNTIKKSADIKYFFEKGIRLFASDCEDDIRNIATNAPGSNVYVRILTEGAQTADWPLSRKFGCQTEMSVDLMVLAKELGLNPVGISFHVGSQQREIATWGAAISKVKTIADRLKKHNIKLKLINMGGGFPVHYLTRTHEIDHYAENITRYLKQNFGDDIPEIILEPGRSLAGEAGVIVSEVITISKKSIDGLSKWVFTDVGVFGGLIETLNESIKYPIITDFEFKEKSETFEAVLAGPTCDSMDIMYEDQKYNLPVGLKSGDRLYWLSTGAYTSSYSAVEFNGFPPLKVYYV